MSIEVILTIIGSVTASSGFWAFMLHRAEKNSVEKKMLVGLAHDRIHYLGMRYVELGCITKGEFENLVDYLYLPYKELGGNGSADRIIDEVKKLPICNERIKQIKED